MTKLGGKTIERDARYLRALLGTNGNGVNVKNFGARGDGVTDDGAAIQAAIDCVGATTYYCNLHLYFPAGTYLVTSSIDLTDKRNIVIEGAGGGYDGYATTKILSRANGKPALDLSGSANITMRDLTIYGDSTNSPSCGILLARTTATNGTNSALNHLERVDVDGYYTVCALYSWASEVNTYYKCWFRNFSTSGKCAVFIGARNRYSITSDYATFLDVLSSVVGKFQDCIMSLYNATSADAVLVLGDNVGSFEFVSGYAQSNVVCPTVELEGTQYSPRFLNWYIEHNNATTTYNFTLYDGAGEADDVIVDGGSGSLTPSDYFIDQPADHIIKRLYLNNTRAYRIGEGSFMRFLGTVDESLIKRWWTVTPGDVTFNILRNSEVWYGTDMTVTYTEISNSQIIKLDVNTPIHWFAGRTLRVGTYLNESNSLIANVSKILTNSDTWDPGSLGDGASANKDIGINDGYIVDEPTDWVCLANFSGIAASANWQVSAHLVTGTGNVNVVITNHTGSTVDLGSGTLRVVAMKVA